MVLDLSCRIVQRMTLTAGRTTRMFSMLMWQQQQQQQARTRGTNRDMLLQGLQYQLLLLVFRAAPWQDAAAAAGAAAG